MEQKFKAEVSEKDGKLEYIVKDCESKCLFNCYLYDSLLEGMPQIHIETSSAVYDGPIAYLFN